MDAQAIWRAVNLPIMNLAAIPFSGLGRIASNSGLKKAGPAIKVKKTALPSQIAAFRAATSWMTFAGSTCFGFFRFFRFSVLVLDRFLERRGVVLHSCCYKCSIQNNQPCEIHS